MPHEISFIVSSNPATAKVSNNGSAFQIDLDQPLFIPQQAKDVHVSVEQASIWWNIPNIQTNINDKMYIRGLSAVNVLTDYDITIPQGLYDVKLLTRAILRSLENQGAKIDPTPLISLTSDAATQKIIIVLNYVSTRIDFTQPATFREMLGFDSRIVDTLVAPFEVLADNEAKFNTINHFLIHSDLVDKGILVNNMSSQTIAQVLITSRPGSQILYEPYNPAQSKAESLIGSMRGIIRFWLTDDNNNLVNTAGDIWSARILIKYEM